MIGEAPSPETYCVCRSSRLASLSVCWAPTCPHAVAADGQDTDKQSGIRVEKSSCVPGRDVKYTHKSLPSKTCEEDNCCAG